MAMKREQSKEVNLNLVERGTMEACLLGTTPIVLNRMSNKARQQLLLPSGRKTEAEKKSSLKHDPLQEYRASAYTDKSPDGPTVLQIIAAGVKLAMASIPLDLPDTGTSKAQLERLLFATEDRVPLYGVPRMLISVTRNSDMNHTPDIRTRAIVPRWAAKVAITYVKPVLRMDVVEKLLAAAGFMRGIGDWRPEKGSGNYGCFEIVQPDDPRFLFVIENGGRGAQVAALETPDFYDDETAEMFAWFLAEKDRKGFVKTDEATDEKGGNGKAKKGRSRSHTETEVEVEVMDD